MYDHKGVGIMSTLLSFFGGLGRVKRIAIFIDGSNLYHSLVDLLGHARLDYGKFVQKLSEGHEVYRTYYYNVQLNQQADPDAYRSQQRFHSYLRNLPFFELRLGVLRTKR